MGAVTAPVSLDHVPLLAECVLLFVVLPLLVRAGGKRIPPVPVLWLATLYAVWRLNSAGVHLWPLWRPSAVAAQLPGMLLLFGFVAAVVLWSVRRYRPVALFSLPRKKPGLWLLIMVLYPLLSVVPQSIVYRAFFLQRYSSLFHFASLPAGVAAAVPWLFAGAAFGWMHVVFRNRLAIFLTLLGGGLFAWRYQVSGSLLACTIEHALYGCLMFTAGLGESFYHRRVEL